MKTLHIFLKIRILIKILNVYILYRFLIFYPKNLFNYMSFILFSLLLHQRSGTGQFYRV